MKRLGILLLFQIPVFQFWMEQWASYCDGQGNVHSSSSSVPLSSHYSFDYF